MNPTSHSYLFVPGNRPDRFSKALQSGAHEIIFDLEDAVPAGKKEEAREAVIRWLDTNRSGIVRINAADTEWYEDDVRALSAFHEIRVLLPKANRAALDHTAGAMPDHRLIGLVETVSGYLALRDMAGGRGLERLAFGSVDFATDSGINDTNEAMTAIRTQIVLESRAAGLASPLDGVTVDFADAERNHMESLRARDFGFGGKMCIHPLQVTAVNAAFQPSPAEIEWARRVVAAADESGGAATAVDGTMIDKPMIERAHGVVRRLGQNDLP
ncbi:CoA ester lyase [Caballeronia sp. LZ065]|uniref:HpcH/HpaI aldolase/citrate lyase family protein n=1 Tax=Caballeronia sp. LZ065 TaxID=3038571 RepID=UPI002864749C|nr:CoA ester lyase [Caballeronia sp. LZ065]MDR5781102.1 CoA ester lyase [Caballeronia sp. LZ065]